MTASREPTGPGRRLRTALFEGQYERAFQLARDLREANTARGQDTAPPVLYAGACALFGLGHILQAEDWVAAHGEAVMYRAEHLYLSAYVDLHKQLPERALLAWTRIVQDDPSETFADELIDRLKRGESRVYQELRQPGAFLRYVPLDPVDPPDPGGQTGLRRARGALAGNESEVSAKFRQRTARSGSGRRDAFWWLVAGIVLLAIPSVAVGVYFREIVGFFGPDAYASIEEELPDAPVRGSVVRPDDFGEGDFPRFVYDSRDAALADYRAARAKIGDGLPNEARYLLGKLELSNAGFEIKERARLLRDAIPDVPRGDFRDPLDLTSILQEPYIYRDAQIDWIGRVRGVRRSDGGIGFEFIPDLQAEAAAGIQVLYPQAAEASRALPEIGEGQPVRIYARVARVARGQLTLLCTDLEVLD